ncbi:MAG: glycosyltransferase family 4 protein [Bacteroidetes bacterium]|nr:glycosyltransferase family 4 protein [Bacteroidota bacterium]
MAKFDKNKMKIAVNTRFLIKDRIEGIGRVTFELLKRLVRDHPEDEFFFLFDRPFDDTFLFGENVTPYVVAPQARHPLLWYAWFEYAIPRVLKKIKPDVFLSPDGYLSLSATTSSVMIVHDIAHHHFPEQVPWMSMKYYNYFVPRYLRKADGIVTVSEFTKKDIIAQYGIHPAKIKVGCNAAGEQFKPLEKNQKQQIREQYAEGVPYFFYVGSVNPRKNVHRLIEAFDRFREEQLSSAKLLISGRFGWLTGEVKTAFEQAKYKSDIHFLGYLSEEELPKVMGAARAFVYPSLFEGFGIPILEAMQCDVPVITSNTSVLPETAGDAAYLVNPYKTKEITKAMKAIWNNESFCQALIQKGRKQKELFSWERTASIVYDSLIDQQ